MAKTKKLFTALCVTLSAIVVASSCGEPEKENRMVKLTFDDPVVVAWGAEHFGYGWSEWGPTQFPSIYHGDNGELIVKYSLGGTDSTDDYGDESIKAYCVSYDGGKTWRRVEDYDDDYTTVRALTGTKLTNGERLRITIPAVTQVDSQTYDELRALRTEGYDSLPIERLPDELKTGTLDPTKMTCYRSDAGGLNERLVSVGWDFPAETVYFPPTDAQSNLKKGVVRIWAYSPNSVKVAPDGKVWFGTSLPARDPATMEESKYWNLYFFCSEDNGLNFEMKGYIMCTGKVQTPDGEVEIDGYYEPELCFMPDGGMIAVIRTGSVSPSLITRSVDGGMTWTTPVYYDRCGIRPGMVRLNNGATICIYGRPGMYVRATSDPSGMTWDDPYELMPYEYMWYNPDKLFSKSCFNSQITYIDDDTAMIVYSDFFTVDEKGVNRKAIKVRLVHAELV